MSLEDGEAFKAITHGLKGRNGYRFHSVDCKILERRLRGAVQGCCVNKQTQESHDGTRSAIPVLVTRNGNLKKKKHNQILKQTPFLNLELVLLKVLGNIL